MPATVFAADPPLASIPGATAARVAQVGAVYGPGAWAVVSL